MRFTNTISLIAYVLLFNACSIDLNEKQPNVLFISVDDWNDWVGCLDGHPGVKTPNLDQLAREGLLFEKAYCPSPVCNPSRTAILTGKMPSSSGIYDNSQWWIPNMPNTVTLPKYFRNNGYHTAGAGKIFHHTAGFNDPEAWDEYFMWDKKAKDKGLAEGWQDSSAPLPDSVPASLITERTKVFFDYAPLPVSDMEMPDNKTARWAGDFLSEKHDKPFFLAVGMFRPHIQWYVPQEYFDMYPLDDIQLPDYLENDLEDVPEIAREMALDQGSDQDYIEEKGIWKELIQAYLASISFSDAQVGIVLKALREGPNASNTNVVLWSDHGYHLGEKDHWHKSTLWQRSTHVPLIIKAPGLTKNNSICASPVSLISLYPTLAELCGLPKPTGTDGISIFPLLANPDLDWESPVLVEYLKGNCAIIAGKYQLIHYRDGENELYDLEKDPNEWKNLVNEPEYTNVMKKLLKEVPKKFANEAIRKNQYIFDPGNYTFTDKSDNKVYHGFSNGADYSWIMN